MMQRQIPENPFAPWCELEQNLAAVLPTTAALDKSAGRQAVGEFYRAVVLNLQPFCQLANPWSYAGRQPFQRQHQLMLAGFKPSVARGLLAEMQKRANLVPQFGQRLEIGEGEALGHRGIISYQDYIVMCIVTRHNCRNENGDGEGSRKISSLTISGIFAAETQHASKTRNSARPPAPRPCPAPCRRPAFLVTPDSIYNP